MQPCFGELDIAPVLNTASMWHLAQGQSRDHCSTFQQRRVGGPTKMIVNDMYLYI